ncbi:DUF6531 domain-containing protein [Gottfriedia luciferensis]|uniref:DUF6531 domain-containing protein n=1 Tax=Gottfriedia luciferensis TaxID=178774 RepID=UPI000B43B754|nr:DUF6531 domain-containing protein [Gottfriedia luciferensis]
MRFRHLKKLLPATLVLTLAFSSYPLTLKIVKAEENSKTEAEYAKELNNQINLNNQKNVKAPPVVDEELKQPKLVEQSEYSNTYYLGKGEYKREIFTSPINNSVGKDKYVPASTKLIEKDSEFTPENTKINIKFKKQITNGEYSNLSIENHNLTYSFLGGVGPEKQLNVNENIKPTIKNNEITYENILDSINLRNIVLNDSVEEDIILTKYTGLTNFTFHIKTDLTASKNGEGEVVFKDASDKTLYSIPSLHMTDSSIDENSGGATYSDKVTYELKKVDDGYNLLINANDEWLQSPDRKYPVFINPEIKLENDNNISLVTSEESDSVTGPEWDSNQGKYILKVGNTVVGKSVALVNPEIQGLKGAIIKKATVSIDSIETNQDSVEKDISLDAITEKWDTESLTWNNMPESEIVDTDSIKNGDTANFDVTDSVQEWAEGKEPNYGFKLYQNTSEQTSATTFSTTESSDLMMVVTYSYPTMSPPTGSVYSYNDHTNTGYMDLSWTAATGAKGYKLWFYTGKGGWNGYQSIDVGNVTTWSSRTKKIWPTATDIQNGTVDKIYTDKTGAELPRDPSDTYRAAGSTLYSNTPNYFIRVTAYYDDGGESVKSNPFTPIMPLDIPQGVVEASMDPNTGFVQLNWLKDSLADGYRVYIFNGNPASSGYEGIDVGNTTTWSTQNQKLWPTASDISAGKYSLHADHLGSELAKDPSPVYRAAGSTVYANSKNYWFRVTSYYIKSDGSVIESALSNAYMPTIPDSIQKSMLGTESYWTMFNVLGGEVNAVNGNFVSSYTDFSIPTTTNTIETTRTYNSQSVNEGLFGYGWTSQYEMNITEDSKGNIIYTDGDGTSLTYLKVIVDNKNHYRPPVGYNNEIVKESDGTYLVTSTDNTTYTFNTNGKLTQINEPTKKETIKFDQSNNKLNSISVNEIKKVDYAYGSNGKVSTITYYVDGKQLTWKYNYQNNLLESVSDSKGNTTNYVYENNLLKEIREPNYTESNPSRTLYGYTDGKLTSITNAKNKVMQVVYDANARMVTVRDYKGTETVFVYDDYGNPIKKIVDPNGLNIQTKTVYRQNKLSEESDANTVAKGASQPSSTTGYDGKGNVTGEKTVVSTDDGNREVEENCYQYDDDNNLKKETNEFKPDDGNLCENKDEPILYKKKISLYTNQDSNTLTTINPDGSSTGNLYDANGNLTQSTGPISPANNLFSNSGMEHSTFDIWKWGVNDTHSQGSYSIIKYNTNNPSDPNNLNIYDGQQALKITPKTDVNTIGWHAVTQTFNVEANTTYTLSGYFKTENLKNANAFFNIHQKNGLDGTGTTVKYHRSDLLNGTRDWEKRQITFTTLSTAVSVLVYLEVEQTGTAVTGSAYYDDIQLEKSETSTSYNPVENSSFENGTANWTISDPADATFDTSTYFDGKQSLKITKTDLADYATSFDQTINLYQNSARPVTISAMSKGQVTNEGTTPVYGLYFDINYMDGTTSLAKDNPAARFARGTHDWQRSAATINPTKPIKSIKIYTQFGKKIGTVWFDNFRVQEGTVWSIYEYDSNGNVTKTTDPLGNSTSASFNDSKLSTQTTDGENYKRNFTYDDVTGNIKTASLPNQTKASYEYDPNGNLTEKKITNQDGSTVYYKTTYKYNELNQLESMIDPLGKETKTTYDNNGNNETITTPNGHNITNTYDNANRLIDFKVQNNSWFKYDYDKNGNITKITDVRNNNQDSSFTYDSNRMKSQTINSKTTSWEYNEDKLAIRKIDDESGVKYTYDSGDHNTLVVDSEGKKYRFDYNDTGTMNTFVSGNNVGTSMKYDSLDRINRLLINDSNGTTIAGYKYDYDKRDNVKTITYDNGRVYSYQYDENNQLKIEKNLTTNEQSEYVYDNVGNRKQKIVSGSSTNKTINYEYNSANQLTKVDGQAYTYDNNGNLTNDGKFIYVWDELNNLTMVKKVSDNSEVAKYKYDNQNRRIYKEVGSNITKFVYDGDSILPIYETDNNGKITYKYIYNANDELVARYDAIGSKKYYYHLNQHGDVIAVTDDNGSVVASYEYDAWGNVESKSGSYADVNPIRYAGYYYDSEINLYYLIARYYNSQNGTFISRDNFSGDNSDIFGQNGYLYVSGNPVFYVDKTGNYQAIDGISVKKYDQKTVSGYNYWKQDGYEYYERSYTFTKFDFYTAQVGDFMYPIAIGWLANRFMGPTIRKLTNNQLKNLGAGFLIKILVTGKVSSVPDAGTKEIITYRRKIGTKSWYMKLTFKRKNYYDSSGWKKASW